MGNELNEPILEKNSFDLENNFLKFGVSSIQGWKSKMEDYNFYSIDIFQNSERKFDIFGIFDGHGGPEIAKYISTHFLDFLYSKTSFKEGKYNESLKETFIDIDNSLNTEEGKKELEKISEEFKLNNEEEILEINKTCGKGESLSEKEIDQIKCLKNLLNPKNLTEYNISNYTGCSGIVVLITNDKIYIANAGNCRCIPIDENWEVIQEKVNKLHLINDDIEKERINNSMSFKEKKIYPEFIYTSRGFGDFEYKENKWLKPEDQAISPEPEVTEITYNECKYLIIGSHGLFDENKDMKLFEKSNQDISDFFMEQIKNNKNKKISKIIEEYYDIIIPKEKKEDNQSYTDNITCFVIQLFERPKLIVNQEDKIDSDEKEKMEKFKKKEASNNSMKNLFSFFTKAQNKNDKNDAKDTNDKKLDSSSSFSNLFKKIKK
jgi:serine/threonine protein phosphatase PrpC